MRNVFVFNMTNSQITLQILKKGDAADQNVPADENNRDEVEDVDDGDDN